MEPNGDVLDVRVRPNTQVVAHTTDGTSLYWTEQSGVLDSQAVQTHFELWRAPYQHDLAAMMASATRVASVDGADVSFGMSMVFDGVFAAGHPKKALAIRLSDGRVKRFTVEEPLIEQAYPFYVDRDSIWTRYTYPIYGKDHYARILFAW
jgi:hypothetical protein